MASVAGVGQLLETVGVPAAQVGSGNNGTVPEQDFATAMQQAGGPSAQALAGQTQAQNDAENGAVAAGANTTSGTRSGSAKTAGASDATPAGQPSRRPAVAGHAQGVGRGLANRAMPGTANAAGSKQGAVTFGKSVDVSGVNEQIAPEATVAGQVLSQFVSLSGTDKNQMATAKAPVPAGRSSTGVEVASTAAGAPLKNVVAAANAAKTGSGSAGTVAKSAATVSASAGIESKLTAMVPQGTADVAQPSVPVMAAVLSGSTSAVTLPVVVDAASATVPSGSAVSAVAAGAPATVGVSTAPAKLTGARGGGAQAASRLVDTTSEAMGTAASEFPSVKGTPMQGELATAVTGTVSKTAAATTAAIAVAPVEQKAEAVAGAPARIAEAVPSAASTAQIVETQAIANQTVTAANGSTDEATPSVQEVLQKAGLVEASAGKPGVHGGRSTAAALKTARDTASTDSPNPSRMAATPQTPQTSAVPTPGVTSAVLAPVAHTSAAGNPKPEVKAGSAAVAPAQGAPAATKGTAPTTEVASETATAKIPGDAGHAVAAAQPTVLPVEQGTTAVASVPVPVAHEAGAGAGSGTSTGAVVSFAGAASVTTATHDTASGTSLSHTTLSSTPTSLEVGVSSGTHGWLKIRAELNAAGEVNASLTGTSTAATEKLRGELPALSNYLQGEKLAIGTLDVRSALHTTTAMGEGSATFSQAGSGQGSAGQQGANQGPGQANTGGAATGTDAGSTGDRSQQGGSAVSSVSAVGGDEVVAGRGSDAALYTNSIELGDNAGPSPVGYGAGGGWLNVRA